MSKVKQITATAKRLYKTGRYKKWTDAIKAASKKIGAVKIVQKGEPRNAKVTKVIQQVRKKDGTFKGYKRIGSARHSDSKSHNVNIRVVSGIGKVINGLKRKYIAIYQNSKSVVDNQIFEATSLVEAKRYASVYKKQHPKLSRLKTIRTTVKLYQ